jgi:uncharacterized membrane protein HdeD (DUF308 family)
VPTGAHLFELPRKIGLSEQQYLAVQQIYRGWALFGVVLIAAIVANLAAAVALRRRPERFWSSLLAGLLLALTLLVFFVWTYPANEATANWTAMPADWQALRRQREFSHAVNAVLTFAALGFSTLSLLGERDRPF